MRQDTAGYGRIQQDMAGYGRIRVLQEYGRIRETPLVIERGAPFHSVTWHSHGTIAGMHWGGGPHRGRMSWSTPHNCRSMALSPWH